MIAGGNVRIKFKDYTAVGPKAQVFIDNTTQNQIRLYLPDAQK